MPVVSLTNFLFITEKSVLIHDLKGQVIQKVENGVYFVQHENLLRA